MSETNRIEYKQELTDGLEKEVIAFLNYQEGGLLYIGIDKKGKAIGLEDVDGDMLKIKDRLKTNISPSCMGLFDVVHETKNNKEIIKIIVASGTEKPYYIKKQGMSERGCFIRIGTAADPMPNKMIEELFSKRTRNSISKIKSNHQELTFEQLKIYYNEAGIKLNAKYASNLELLTEEGDYNYVAYLMSDKNTFSVKVAKYKGITRSVLLESNEYGFNSIIKATKQVLDKIDLENTTFTKITSKERINNRLWNEIAIREAVINAFVHNDYTNETPIKFELFDDRIEITSAGGLTNGINQQEFFEGYSVPRNKELMRIYKDLNLVEQLGSGVPRILETYPKSCFTISENFLRMSFPKEKHDQVADQVADQVTDQVEGKLLQTDNIKYLHDRISDILNNRSTSSILDAFELTQRVRPILSTSSNSKLNPTEEEIKNYLKILETLGSEQVKILQFAKPPKSNKEIQEDCLGLKKHTFHFKHYIEPLLNMKVLERTLPHIPNSRLQKYFTTEKGQILLSIYRQIETNENN